MKAEVVVKEISRNDNESLFTQGNILISGSGTLVLVNLSENSTEFSGVCLKAEHWEVGFYSQIWTKNTFSQFKGDIKLKI